MTFTTDEALAILQALQYEVELVGPDVLRASCRRTAWMCRLGPPT